ncbi:MAG: hypothetical protein IKM31_08565 [Oscillospiraceae bacterium]|nr:hypothetical protein [Oscillospiraceae bacterium]
MKRQYIRSERAHFMCPNMHFAILMELDAPCDADKLQHTADRLAAAHPFLRGVIAEENGKLYYDVQPGRRIIPAVSEVAALMADYAKIAEEDWDIFTEGMLKIWAAPSGQGMTVLLIAHHLLADGRGLLELAREFAADYVTGKSPAYAEEVLLESIADLPPKSALTGVSRLLVRRANAGWKKENHAVTWEQYRKFAAAYCKAHPASYESWTVGPDETERMAALCRENGVSMNDLLMAEMYLRTGTDKIIIAADIRNRFPRYVPGSMGNYSTAMGIRFRAKSDDPVTTAKQVRQAVRKAMGNNRSLMMVLACYFEMDPGLLDAAAISALGGFESRAASFVGGSMFGFGGKGSYSITNLGKLDDENIRALTFIPPASPAAKFTLGVVTLNGTMRACAAANVR